MVKRLRGEEKFPLVLMLEPTHQCNLSCQGCGRIQEYRETLGQALTVEECLQAVEDCGAPVVTITGGEPLLYPPVFELLAELVHRGKHIYLCTNAILLEKSLPRLPRSDRLTLSLHVDGLAPTHDRLLGVARAVQPGHQGHQGRQGPGLPGVHQHHHLQGNRGPGDRDSVLLPGASSRRGRPPGVPGLQLCRSR